MWGYDSGLKINRKRMSPQTRKNTSSQNRKDISSNTRFHTNFDITLKGHIHWLKGLAVSTLALFQQWTHFRRCLCGWASHPSNRGHFRSQLWLLGSRGPNQCYMLKPPPFSHSRQATPDISVMIWLILHDANWEIWSGRENELLRFHSRNA
jgi:hypothetical protein